MSKGLLYSLLTVLFWALYDISVKISVTHFDVKANVFVCVNLIMASLVMLIISGPGKLGLETLRQPHTWAYSFISIINDVFFTLTLLYIAASEASFVKRASIVFVLIMVWMFLSRRPSKHDVIGTGIVLVGCYIIIVNFDPEVFLPATLLLALGAFTRAILNLIAETHPTSNKASTIKEQIRCTGFIMLASSISFSVLSALMGYAFDQSNIDQYVAPALVQSIPSLSDFLHTPTILCALVIGPTIIALDKYFFFVATKTAKSELFSAVLIFLPLATYILEKIGSYFGVIDISSITTEDLLAGVVIMAGAIYMIYMRHKFPPKPKKEKEIKIPPMPAE